MDQKILDQMMAMAEAEDAAELSVKYLENQLRTFLKTGERVLICFSNARVGGLGWLLGYGCSAWLGQELAGVLEDSL